MTRRAIITPWFDANAIGGGARFSIDIARACLEAGDEVHILAAAQPRVIPEDLAGSAASGRLQVHAVADPAHIAETHAIHADIYARARDMLLRIAPSEVHLHNFHGLLGAALAAMDLKMAVIYTALDLGLVCPTFYRFDGSAQPCDGPGAVKCARCILRNEHSFAARAALRAPAGLLRRHPRSGRLLATRERISGLDAEIETAKSLLPKFAWIVAPSPVVAREISSNAPAARIVEIPYGVEPARRRPTPPRDAGPLRLLYLGHESAIKGWPFLLGCLHGLEDGLDLEIVVCGRAAQVVPAAPPKARRYLRPRAPAQGKELLDVIAQTDAAIVPSLWHENSPFVILESFANARPVLAADQAGIRHLVSPGVDGHLIPPADRAAWSDLLRRVARDPRGLRAMSGSCRYDPTPQEHVRQLDERLRSSARVAPAATSAGA